MNILKLLLMVLIFGQKISAQEYPILNYDKPIKIVNLEQLNTSERECNLSILPNGKSLYFMTTRAQKNGTNMGNGDIYRSDLVNGKWQEPMEVGGQINTINGEDEPSFNTEGDVMYYQSWDGNWKLNGGPYYSAKYSNGAWRKVGSVGAQISAFFADRSNENFGYATDGMAISPNGKLFIVACGNNYMGPMDLYYSQFKNGKWSNVELMGISTDGDERSVFIAGDNRTIYYSSDGMGGLGGLDIFKVRIDDNGKLGTPVNIGAPFNTKEDDMGFVASLDGKSAFFIRNLDIYFADISELQDELKPKKDNGIKVEPDPEPQPKPQPKIKNLSVFFSFDKFDLTDKAEQTLNSIEMDDVYEVHGYCDSDGGIAYNEYLAKSRCQEVINYLTRQGIPKENLILVVHGEKDPKYSNQNTNGKAKNRRVDIILK